MDKYTKITYESEPIGKERIVLQLTTLDLKAFNENKNLKKIPTKRTAIQYEFNRYDLTNQNLIENMQKEYEIFIRHTYEQQIKEMQGYIEFLRSQNDIVPQATWYDGR